MSSLTEYAVEQIFAGTGLPATLYMKLHTADPGPAGLLSPCLQATRPAVTFSVGADPEVYFSDASVTYPGPQPASEIGTHASFWDASSGGNCWIIGETTGIEFEAAAGDVVLAAGAVTLTIPIWGV